jgi:hypothetical protein
MNIEIISDGTPTGTKARDRDTGGEIKNIVGIKWRIEIDSLAVADITLIRVPVTLQAKIVNQIDFDK